MKKLLFTKQTNQRHWVGDGFPVRSIFTYNDIAKDISPFLLMDYAEPTEFPPATRRRGVGEHPHRGFETVTIVYAGEVEHRDSAGGGGVIGSGDVQWMTAASGLVHEEMHGENFSRDGGAFEMVQLWVNLPAKDKMNKPRYQGLKDASIPRVPIGSGVLRVIAGEYEGHKGPALTHTPINLWDLRLPAGASQDFLVKEGHTLAVFVLDGEISVGGSEGIGSSTLAVLERKGERFSIETKADSKLLILSGEPINEPIVGYGPFVMNNRAEIQQAFVDFQEGRMGSIDKIVGSES